MRISKEVKVGILAVVSITILYFGFNYLKGIDFRSATNRYYLVFDKVGELQESNPVKIEGVPVGRVGRILLIQQKKNRIVVAIDVNSSVKISKGATGELKSVLMGDTYIGLRLPENEPPFYLDGDTITSYYDEGLSAIMNEAGTLMDSLQLTISYLNNMLQVTTNTMEGVNGMLDENRYSIRGTMNNLKKGTDSLTYLISDARKMMQGFTGVTDSLKALQLNETLAKAQEMMTGISTNMDAIKNQEGTMGKLMYNDSLYNNLNQAMVDLDSLFVDLKENPSRYVQVSVFGKKDKTQKKK